MKPANGRYFCQNCTICGKIIRILHKARNAISKYALEGWKISLYCISLSEHRVKKGHPDTEEIEGAVRFYEGLK